MTFEKHNYLHAFINLECGEKQLEIRREGVIKEGRGARRPHVQSQRITEMDGFDLDTDWSGRKVAHKSQIWTRQRGSR